MLLSLNMELVKDFSLILFFLNGLTVINRGFFKCAFKYLTVWTCFARDHCQFFHKVKYHFNFKGCSKSNKQKLYLFNFC